MGLTREQARRLGIEHLHPDCTCHRPAPVRGAMNVTEGWFASWLEGLRIAGPVESWAFEVETLVLGPDLRYTPDFRVRWRGVPEVCFYDVKGRHIWEDSVVKGKAAAVIYPQHRFYLACYRRARVVAGAPGEMMGGFEPGGWYCRRLGVARGHRELRWHLCSPI
jgi:hypothetical protein